MTAQRAEKLLILVLRFEAAILILALPAMLLPTEWMASVHQWLGLGTFPRGAIVEYLTRSLSALYALWAPLLLYLTFDLKRYLALIAFLAWMRILLGIALLILDLWIGMPLLWTLGEGPGIVAISVIQYLLAKKLMTGSSESGA